MFIAGSTQSLRRVSYSDNKNKKKQKVLPAAFIFNLPTETGLTLPCLHVTSAGSSLLATNNHLCSH
jgi:hypothetical protein